MEIIRSQPFNRSLINSGGKVYLVFFYDLPTVVLLITASLAASIWRRLLYQYFFLYSHCNRSGLPLQKNIITSWLINGVHRCCPWVIHKTKLINLNTVSYTKFICATFTDLFWLSGCTKGFAITLCAIIEILALSTNQVKLRIYVWEGPFPLHFFAKNNPNCYFHQLQGIS